MRLYVLVMALLASISISNPFVYGGVTPIHKLAIAPQVRATGSYLGVTLLDIDSDRAKSLSLDKEQGVEITRVQPDSPAEKAGLRAGDVLLTYNGEPILGAQQLGRLVWETPQGRKVKIQYWRDKKVRNVVVTTGAPPSMTMDGSAELTPLDMSSGFPMPDIPSPLLIWTSPALGIECEPVEGQLAKYFGVEHGVLVRAVAKGSSADRGGMKAGDVLIKVGKRAVATPRDLTAYLRMRQEPTKPVLIGIIRDHASLTLHVLPRVYPE